MATRKSTTMNTGRIPLEFAKAVSAAADAAWKDGSFVKSVTPVTRELLKYWFEEPFTNRPLNFHEGQRQAILNAIYLHEVANAANPSDAWEKVAPAMLAADGASVMAELAKPKYAYPKYCVKMATGTGKTWVMHALLIWQYLNEKYGGGAAGAGRPPYQGGEQRRVRSFTKNFLFVAPGLIVYERLLDAFCGNRRRRRADGKPGGRDFRLCPSQRRAFVL